MCGNDVDRLSLRVSNENTEVVTHCSMAIMLRPAPDSRVFYSTILCYIIRPYSLGVLLYYSMTILNYILTTGDDQERPQDFFAGVGQSRGP